MTRILLLAALVVALALHHRRRAVVDDVDWLREFTLPMSSTQAATTTVLWRMSAGDQTGPLWRC